MKLPAQGKEEMQVLRASWRGGVRRRYRLGILEPSFGAGANKGDDIVEEDHLVELTLFCLSDTDLGWVVVVCRRGSATAGAGSDAGRRPARPRP